MPEPSREAREAAEAFAVEFVTSKPHGSAGDEIVWLGDRLTLPIVDSPGQTAVSVAMMRVTTKRAFARALDDFAEKWREEAERRNVAAGEASAKFLEEHRQRVKAEQERDALRRKLSAMHRRAQVAEGELVKMRDPHEWMRRAAMVQQLSDIAKHNDALRRRVSDLQRRVDHCECESLIDHVRDCLPEYEHDDNVHGESEPFNEIETIEEAGREIDALRRRVAELKDVCVPCKRPAVYCICKLEHDVLVAEGRAEAAEKALAKYGGHDTLCTVAGGYDAPCDCGLEKARRARGEGK